MQGRNLCGAYRRICSGRNLKRAERYFRKGVDIAYLEKLKSSLGGKRLCSRELLRDFLQLVLQLFRSDFHSLPVIFFVILADRAHDAARRAVSNDIGGDVFCNNAPGSYHGVISDGNAGHDDAVCTDPDVIAYRNGKVILCDLFTHVG